MALLEKIQKDSLIAAKEGRAVDADILRVVLASLKNAKIAKGPEEKLTEQEEIKIVFSESKKIKDSIVQFRNGGREDLAKREEEQLACIQKYLPAQAEAADVDKAVEDAISKTGATEIKDMGKVMGVAMKSLQGKADGAAVSEAVKRMLSK